MKTFLIVSILLSCMGAKGQYFDNTPDSLRQRDTVKVLMLISDTSLSQGRIFNTKNFDGDTIQYFFSTD